MSEKDLNIKLAELLGYEVKSVMLHNNCIMLAPEKGGIYTRVLFTRSLDMVHLAEQQLVKNWKKYTKILKKISPYIAGASAHERVEALIKYAERSR